LDYFWCIKYQHDYLFICENGKREKRKKGKTIPGKRAEGGILGCPERAGARASRPRRPTNEGMVRAGTGPRASEGEGETTLGGRRGSTRKGEPVTGA
jgi:hypothetical protein